MSLSKAPPLYHLPKFLKRTTVDILREPHRFASTSRAIPVDNKLKYKSRKVRNMDKVRLKKGLEKKKRNLAVVCLGPTHPV